MNIYCKLYFYPYRKIQNIPVEKGDVMNEKYLYTFKSPKSKQWYWVWVEAYYYNMYAIKFHLKADRNSPLKYHRLTGLNEARMVIGTCIAIMLEINESNSCSSFGFIGSNLPNENERETKRFRVYKRIMATHFPLHIFDHRENKDKSTYMLIRKTELEKDPDLIQNIEHFFADNYVYFD
jgi:hypothetical protein